MTDARSPRCYLLPCPFCGGKGAITLGMVREVKTVDVICQDCGGAMPAFCEEDAIADWNARPDGVAPAAPVDILIANLEQAVSDRLANCSKGPELEAARQRLRDAFYSKQ